MKILLRIMLFTLMASSLSLEARVCHSNSAPNLMRRTLLQAKLKFEKELKEAEKKLHSGLQKTAQEKLMHEIQELRQLIDSINSALAL